jgi:hypothetical protein
VLLKSVDIIKERRNLMPYEVKNETNLTTDERQNCYADAVTIMKSISTHTGPHAAGEAVIRIYEGLCLIFADAKKDATKR